MNIILENEELKLKITNFGAELQEINSKTIYGMDIVHLLYQLTNEKNAF